MRSLAVGLKVTLCSEAFGVFRWTRLIEVVQAYIFVEPAIWPAERRGSLAMRLTACSRVRPEANTRTVLAANSSEMTTCFPGAMRILFIEDFPGAVPLCFGTRLMACRMAREEGFSCWAIRPFINWAFVALQAIDFYGNGGYSPSQGDSKKLWIVSGCWLFLQRLPVQSLLTATLESSHLADDPRQG